MMMKLKSNDIQQYGTKKVNNIQVHKCDVKENA